MAVGAGRFDTRYVIRRPGESATAHKARVAAARATHRGQARTESIGEKAARLSAGSTAVGGKAYVTQTGKKGGQFVISKSGKKRYV